MHFLSLHRIMNIKIPPKVTFERIEIGNKYILYTLASEGQVQRVLTVRRMDRKKWKRGVNP